MCDGGGGGGVQLPAAVAGDADGIERPQLAQRVGTRHRKEQRTTQAGQGEYLQRIGRAGEIVAVDIDGCEFFVPCQAADADVENALD